MSHILSNTTAEMMQLICRYHTQWNNCGPDCPLRFICTEMVKDWPIVNAEVDLDGHI